MRRQLFFLCALFIADRFIKNILWFKPPQGNAAVFLHPVLNENISFSIRIPGLSGGALLPILACIIFILAGTTYLRFRQSKAEALWWGMITSGALSNFLDRLTIGGVLDYVDIGFWPVFNLSDASIFIGTVMLVASEFFLLQRKRLASSSQNIQNLR